MPDLQALEEKYDRVYSYDPTPEELKKLYGEEFDKWCEDLLKNV